MALPAFTFVFTFMPLLLSRLKLVSTTRDSCLAAPNCATGLYLRFHVHVHTPFSLSWSSMFLPADLRTVLKCPKRRHRPLPSSSRSCLFSFLVELLPTFL